MMKNRGIAFKLVFFILTSCAVIFLVIFAYNYLFSRRIIIKNIESSAKNLTLVTVNKIETVLCSAAEVPESLAYFLEEGSYDTEEMLKLLKSMVENNPAIYGSTAAFEPNAFDKDSLYFAPYFYRSGDRVEFKYLGNDSYRYFYLDWYQIPRELGRPVWSEPYYDVGGGDILMSTYSVPFYADIGKEKKFMGIVTADISLAWLEDIISSIKIARSGYGFLVSKNGTIVSHPQKGLIMNETIFSIAEARDDPRLREIGREMIKGKSGFTPSRSIFTGKECWIAYAPVPSSGWSFGAVFPKDELMADMIRFNRIVLGLGAAGLLFLLIVIVWIAHSITRPLRILAKTTRDIAKGNLDFELPAVRSKDEVGELANSFIYMKGALKRYIKELTEATSAKERIESELRIAHDIQMNILPKVFPPFPDRREFDIYATLEPAKEVGGDFYDFFFIDDDNICFVIGDVSGKGVPAALFMAMVKTLIKSTARTTSSPDEILKTVNEEVSGKNDSCMFVTVFLAILNVRTGHVDYVNAGHNPPLVIHAGKEVSFLKDATGPAIGIFENGVFEKERIVLRPGDTIYMYTDGVTEAMDSGHHLFSEERLKETISKLAGSSIREIIDQMLEEIKSFSHGMPQADDITMLAVRYFSAAKPDRARAAHRTIVLKNSLSEIKKMATSIAEFGKEKNLPPDRINDATLVLEEAINNVVSYGYGDAKEHTIIIDVDLAGDGLSLRVQDDARPFNPLEVTPPDIHAPLESRRVGGLGIHLMRNFTDNLEYKREDGKNILTMRIPCR
ncbi:MAG: SpoIIE family protein phosphatase [Candidatus Omnitrophica bacterium]|nr:SpoIIE family protein phosphatase [Candidatus Omnitrophota bacterium]